MKRHVVLSIGLATALVTLFSCTSDWGQEESPVAIGNEVQEVQALMPAFETGDAETKLDMNIHGNSITLAWSEEDKIGVFPETGDQINFAMSKGAGGSTATFSGGGWALKNNAIYYAYYPFNRECYAGEEMKNQVPCSFEGQVQTGENSLKHLGKYAYMYSSGSTPAEGKVTLSLQHLTTLLKLDLTSSITASATIKSVTLEVPEDETAFCLEGTIDLTKGTLTPAKTSSSITLACGGDIQFTYSNSASVYLVLPPTDLSGKQINVKVETEEFGPMFVAYFIPSQDWKAGRFYTKQLMAYYTGMPVMVSSHIEEIGEGEAGAYREKYYNITYTVYLDRAYFSDTSIASVRFHIVKDGNFVETTEEDVWVDKDEYGNYSYTLKDVHIPFQEIDWGMGDFKVETCYYHIKVAAYVVTDSGKEYFSGDHSCDDTWSWEVHYPDMPEAEPWE